MSILGSIGLGFLDKGLDAVTNAFLQPSRERAAKRIARYNDNLNREMLVDSAALQKAGMNKAGISTAAMGEGFRPAGQAGQAETPMIPDPAPSRVLDAVNLSLQKTALENQMRQTDADARLKAAQADEIELRNVKERELQETWQKTSGDFGQDSDGTFFKKSGVRSADAYNVESQYRRMLFDRKVAQLQLDDPAISSAVATAPIREMQKAAAEIKQLNKQHGLTDAMAALTRAQYGTEQWRKSVMEFDAKMKEYDYKIGKQTDYRGQFVNLINKVFQGNVSWEDALKLGVSLMVMYMDNRRFGSR